MAMYNSFTFEYRGQAGTADVTRFEWNDQKNREEKYFQKTCQLLPKNVSVKPATKT
jgi:hypothetical protein